VAARSHRHHEIPKWQSRHFCPEDSENLWVGFKDTRDVKLVSINRAFFRNDANTRIDYQGQERVKSDRDERILADFDDRASRAARDLIDLARRWRGGRVDDFLLAPETAETCKQIIVAQARRTRESQDRVGIGDDGPEFYLELYRKRAAEFGQQLPADQGFLEDSRVATLFDDLSQNQRATFASGHHSILTDKEKSLLAPLGLHVATIDPANGEFVIGSHGITIVQTAGGQNTWLPLAPDVAISFSGRPGEIGIGICKDDFVESHNRAALSISARVAGRSEKTIRDLLATLGRPVISLATQA